MMLRLMGFLLGSAIALIALLIFTDRPGLEPARAVVEESLTLLDEHITTDAGSISAPEPRSEPTPETPVAREKAPMPVKETSVDATPTESNSSPGTSDDAAPLVARDPPSPQPRWHVFWSPFRNELSARGFADRLEHLTGMDLQVTRVGPGRYQVAFRYLGDAERQSKLAEIAAMTGLRLRNEIP